MEKIKPNHYFGIKTPWNLKNEIVWKKTHRLGYYTAMIGGFVLLDYVLATFISGNVFLFNHWFDYLYFFTCSDSNSLFLL